MIGPKNPFVLDQNYYRLFTLKKLECLKQAYLQIVMNITAWDNKIRHLPYFVGFEG